MSVIFGVVQPRRLADRHREQDNTAKVWDAKSGAEVLTLKGHTARHFGVVQPRRLAGRHRESGQHGEGLGRRERSRGPHAQGAHRLRHFGVVQPRRLADRHRQHGQDGEGLGRDAVQPGGPGSSIRPATGDGEVT